MVDFVSLAATAERLVKENGRSITFFKPDSTAQSAGKPWRGQADPFAIPDDSQVLSGVAVSPSAAASLGIAAVEDDFIKRASQIFICAPGVLFLEDLKTFTHVLDGTDRFSINDVQELRPAAVALLFYVSVRK